MELAAAIAGRRTIKAYTGQAVPRETVAALVEAACWAPNHRLTQPWRFSAIDRDGIARLVAFVQTPPVCTAVYPRKLPSICQRLAACGALVQVTCLLAGSEEQRRDDRDATAAAVQNLLLAAHAAGLGSFWSTSPLLSHREVLRWFGSDPAVEVHVATIWLGYSAENPVVPPRKPLAEVLRWA